MRRFLCGFLAICCILTMAACASESEPAPEESDTVTAEQPPAESEPAPEETPEEAPEETPEEAEPAEEDAPAEDAAEDAAIEVDEGIFTVTITMPATYVEAGTTQDSLDQEAGAGNYEAAVLNEDGSVTYTLTRAQHNAMLEEMRTTIDAALDEMITSGGYPNFVAVEANDDYTEFRVTTSAETVSAEESLAVLGFYIYGGLYQIIDGGGESVDITVQFLSEATGDVIDEYSSSEMA